MNIYFVHGFLGLPRDWHAVESELQKVLPAHTQFHSVNLWDDIKDLSVDRMFYNWADQFAQKLEGEDNWLIGYSLGGRLLLHMSYEVFPRIKAMSLISSHMGLESMEDREVRLEQDLHWAGKFLKEPWNQLMGDWSSQKVFQNDTVRSLRAETNFSRPLLAKALGGWSLGRQKSFWDDEFPFRLNYIHGFSDEKFSAIGQEIKLRLPKIMVQDLPGGHTLHISHPRELSLALFDFYKSFSEQK